MNRVFTLIALTLTLMTLMAWARDPSLQAELQEAAHFEESASPPETESKSKVRSTGPIPRVGVREAKLACLQDGIQGKELIACVSKRVR